MQSKRVKKLIIANSLLLTFLVAGFAYAWFAVNYGSSVDGDEVEVVADSALEISFSGDVGTWKNYLNLDRTKGGVVDFTNLEFRDITGSGAGSFLRPVLTQEAANAKVDTTQDWTPPAPGKDYIDFTLYMRSADPLDVYLGDGSRVEPKAEVLTGLTADNADVNRKSAYGNFSKDLVAGAVRVSAVNSSNVHKFTWIPRPNIYLDLGAEAPKPDNITYDALISTEATSDINPLTYLAYTNGSPYVHAYYASSTATTTTPLDNALTVTGDIIKDEQDSSRDTFTANKNKLLLASLNTKTSGYYQDTVRIRIWLEGCDNEARRVFVGGKFKVMLALTAEDATASE
ncbi:MAG: hypothetical protein ACI4F2_03015 [Acutalibacteraceae bacterium]